MPLNLVLIKLKTSKKKKISSSTTLTRFFFLVINYGNWEQKLTQTNMHAWGGTHEIWELIDENES